MKKQLLGSTALVAAGMLAAAGSADAQQPTPGKISLQLGGYMTQYFGWSDNANDVPFFPGGTNPNVSQTMGGWRGFDQQSDAEFYLLGKTTLDNGITVGVNIEMEIVGSPGQQVDEQWAFIEGAFGQVRLGMEDAPMFLMHYAAPDAGLGLSYSWASYSFIPQPRSIDPAVIRGGGVIGQDNAPGIVGGYDNPINTTRIRMEDDDSNKVIYYTPRIEGFQFGVAYIPLASQDTTTTPGTGGTSLAYSDGWSMGLNFVRKFNPIDIALSGGYQTWTNNSQFVKTNQIDPATPWAFSLGANVGFAGFTFGAGYAEVKDLRYSQTSLRTMNGGKSWDVGVQYDFGATSVSVGYFEGWIDGAVGVPAGTVTAGRDTHQLYQVSLGHRFGPGVAVKGSAFYVDWQDENGTFTNSGPGIAAGLFLNF